MHRISSRIAVWGVLVLPSAALAAGTGGGASGGGGGAPPPSIGTQEQRIMESTTQESFSGQRGDEAAFEISGRVFDGSGLPMSGILVKMFTNGTLSAHAKTDVDGAFSITANPMIGGNNTTDLWFESPDPEKILDSNVVLAAGEVAQEKNLIPRCTQKVELLGNYAEVEVTMMTPDERKISLEQSGCL